MEAFGAYVTWDNANRLVVIKTGSSLLRVHFLDVARGTASSSTVGKPRS